MDRKRRRRLRRLLWGLERNRFKDGRTPIPNLCIPNIRAVPKDVGWFRLMFYMLFEQTVTTTTIPFRILRRRILLCGGSSCCFDHQFVHHGRCIQQGDRIPTH